jgi:hypothetical protein
MGTANLLFFTSCPSHSVMKLAALRLSLELAHPDDDDDDVDG